MQGWVAGPACILLFFLVQLVSSRWAGASRVQLHGFAAPLACPYIHAQRRALLQTSSTSSAAGALTPAPLCSDCPPRRVLAMCYAVDGQEFALFHHAVRYILGRRDGLLLGACQMVNRE